MRTFKEWDKNGVVLCEKCYSLLVQPVSSNSHVLKLNGRCDLRAKVVKAMQRPFDQSSLKLNSTFDWRGNTKFPKSCWPLSASLPPANTFSISSLTTGDVRWMVRDNGGSFVFFITIAASSTDWSISYLSSVTAYKRKCNFQNILPSWGWQSTAACGSAGYHSTHVNFLGCECLHLGDQSGPSSCWPGLWPFSAYSRVKVSNYGEEFAWGALQRKALGSGRGDQGYESLLPLASCVTLGTLLNLMKMLVSNF